MRSAFPLNPAVIWTVTALLLSNAGSQEPEITVLVPSEPLQRHIAPGGEHRFQIAARIGHIRRHRC